jgi:ParB family chromosome partitioning protein
MAKLKAPENAGWNAGKNYYAKMMRIEDIIIDPEIARVFKMSDEIRETVREDMKENGFDKSQPLGLWKGKNVVLDGHTRLAAAREAGLEEVPVVELEFEDKEDAILYTFERQVIRRNLSIAEIITAVEMMPEARSRKGRGRAVAQLAERLKVSQSHLYQIKAILKKASPEDIEAVRAGTAPVKETYLKLRPPKHSRHGGLPDRVATEQQEDRPREPEPKQADRPQKPEPHWLTRAGILTSAVVLLADAKEPNAAVLLVNHFFRKDERTSFIRSLPENAKRLFALEDIIPV